MSTPLRLLTARLRAAGLLFTGLMRLLPRRLRPSPWWLALLLFAHAGDANALCTLVCSCSVSTTPVQFGSVNPLSASNSDTTGSVRVSCGGVVGLAIPYRIDLAKGGGASHAARRLNSGANLLAYNLYLDDARLQLWGDGSGGSQYASGNIALDLLGWSPAQTHWVYGRIPGAQTTTVPGAYTDTIAVTLTYF